MSKSLARQMNNIRDKLKSQSNIETEYEITFEKPHHLGLELGIKDAWGVHHARESDGGHPRRPARPPLTLLEAPQGRRLTLRFARSSGGGQPPLPRRRPGAAGEAAAAAPGGAPPVLEAPSSGAGATATQTEYHTARGAASAGGGRGPSPGLPLPTGVLPGGVVGAAGGGTAPPGGGAREGGGKAGGDVTYSDMIAHALNQLQDRKGTFKEILGLIEKQFAMQLNWKLGSSALRNTPVWKSSVRKILFSNKKFSLADRCYRRGNVFTFTHLTTKK